MALLVPGKGVTLANCQLIILEHNIANRALSTSLCISAGMPTSASCSVWICFVIQINVREPYLIEDWQIKLSFLLKFEIYSQYKLNFLKANN